jgi:hypothetical protein
VLIHFQGMDLVKRIESLGSRSGTVSTKITIADCGEVKVDAPKAAL